MNRLESLGWCSFFQDQLGGRPGEPFRVTADYGAVLRAEGGSGEVDLDPRGDCFRPAVGDWVLARTGGPEGRHAVAGVLERRSVLSRQAAGQRTAEQVIAANVDVVFVVMGLDADFNLRRLERYLAAAWECGARPVVLLTKPDLVDDPPARVLAVEAVAPGVPAHVVAPLAGTGAVSVLTHLAAGVTGILVGSSGVGKSTLVNRLTGGETMRTGPVRADGRGRHVTSFRRLVRIEGAGLLVDVPGMRELALWDDGEGRGAAFPEIAALAGSCRFRDCGHGDEPGCAVRAAVESGDLDGRRLESYRKLAREAAALERRTDALSRREERRRWRAIHRSVRSLHRARR